MREAAPPHDEPARLAALQGPDTLDTPDEPAFDDLAALAAQLCGAPIALVSLLDGGRQWLWSRQGLGAAETLGELTRCASALPGDGLVIVPDSRGDARFASCPRVRFYAGAPLVTLAGRRLGTLCVMDHEPRDLDDGQRAALATLGRLAAAQIESRRSDAAQRQAADLRAAEIERLDALLNTIDEGLLVVDPEGRVQMVNRHFADIWRIPPQLVETRDDERLLGRALEQLTSPEQFLSRVRDLYGQPYATGVDLLDFRDGRTVERSTAPLVVGGQPVARIWAFRDVTARVQAERERLETQERLIAAQAAALAELSTPLVPIAAHVLVMPLVGSIDSRRAQTIVDTILSGAAEARARVVIIDITGVPVVDTQVAAVLVRAAEAVRLLGAHTILCGIRPEVAQTLVSLGTDLRGLTTQGSLQRAIEEALRHAPGRAAA